MLHREKNKFIIFTHNRTGGRSLVEVLRSQDLVTFDEPFGKGCYNNFDLIEDKFYKQYHQNKNYSDLLCNIMLENDCIKHIFCQTSKNFNELILERYPTVFLLRKNTKLAALSFLIAEKTRIWHHNRSQFDRNKTNLSEIYSQIGPIEPEKIEELAKTYEKILFFQKYIHRSFQIFYEDLYSDHWQKQIAKIFDFTKNKIKNWQKIENIMDKKNKLNNIELFENLKNYQQIKSMNFL